MKRILQGLFSGVLILTGCTPSRTAVPVTTIQSATATPSPIPTSTSVPTKTPTASTPALAPGASVTPLPTIPTFTPTFDVSTIVTVTPAAKAECPEEDPNLVPVFYVPKFPECFDTDQCLVSGTEEEILGFLNKGAAIQSVMTRLRTAIYGDYQEYAYQDVTVIVSLT